jgi:hypothetical protein
MMVECFEQVRRGKQHCRPRPKSRGKRGNHKRATPLEGFGFPATSFSRASGLPAEFRVATRLIKNLIKFDEVLNVRADRVPCN